MFYGRGAGGAPTASAVLGDLVAVARNRLTGGRRRRASRRTPTCGCGRWARRRPATTSASTSPTRPGVLAAVAHAFAEHDVSHRRPCARRAAATTRRWWSSRTRAPDAALAATVEDAAATWTSSARRRQRDAGRREPTVTQHDDVGRRCAVARGDRGVPRPAAGHRRAPRSSRCSEGGTPLVPAPELSARTGCEVYLKVEGANPTGSFKDRGMTMAITKAVEEGAKAVICASTGNTSACAAAYAARAGMTCAVLVPQGKIALGKLAQALVHGAKLLQVDGNFDDCLALARKLAHRLPGRAGQLGQPVPDRGPEDRRVRDRRRARRRARRALPAGRQRRQHHRLLEGLPRVRTPAGIATQPPRMCGFQAAGAAPIVHGDGRRAADDDRHRDPDRQPGLAGPRRSTPATSPAAAIDAVTDRRDPRGLPAARPQRGRVRRAGVGGERRRACCRRRGRRRSTPGQRWSARSPATGSRTRSGRSPGAPAPSPSPVDAGTRPPPRSSLGLTVSLVPAPVRVRVPATSANLGPGFDCARPGAGLYDDVVVRGRRRGLDGRRRRRGRRRACPRDERTWSCAPCGPPSTRWAASRAGCELRCAQPDPARPRPRLVGGRDRRRASLARPGARARTATSRSTTTRCSRWPPSSRATRTTSRACLLGGLDAGLDDGRAGARAVRLDGRARRRGRWCSCPTRPLSTHVARGLLPDDRAARRRRAPTPAGPRCWCTR